MRQDRLITAVLVLGLGLGLVAARAATQGPDYQPLPAGTPAPGENAPAIQPAPTVKIEILSTPPAAPPVGVYQWGPPVPTVPNQEAASPSSPGASPAQNSDGPSTTPLSKRKLRSRFHPDEPLTPPPPSVPNPRPAAPMAPIPDDGLGPKGPVVRPPDAAPMPARELRPSAPREPIPPRREEVVPGLNSPDRDDGPPDVGRLAPLPSHPEVELPAPRPPTPLNQTHEVFSPSYPASTEDMGRRPIADSTRPVNRGTEAAPVPAAAPRADDQPPPPPMIPRPAPPAPPIETPPQRPASPAPAVPAPIIPGPAPAEALRNTTTGPLLLEKVGSATVNQGAPLVYELVTRNVTNAPLFNVRVEDDLPPGVQLVSAEPRPEIQRGRMIWSLGAIDAGGERRCRVELMPSGPGELHSCATVTFSTTSCLRTVVTQPHLILKKTAPETVMVGESIAFQLELTNDGNGPATGVMLYDNLPAGLEHPQGGNIEADVGTLAPGETKHVTLECKAIQPGRIVNRARATGHGLSVTAEAVVQVTAPALTLRKAGPRARFIDREAEFDLEVFNPGTAPAANVQVLDRLPPGLDYVSCSDGGVYDVESRAVTWNLGTLGAGQRNGIQLKVVGKAAGEYLNQAFARADRNLEARAEARLRVEGVAALMLEVVDLDDPVEEGNETVYEVHVVNQGSSPCTRLQIVATAPDGMVPRGGTGPTTARVQGQQVIFEPLDRLAPKADATYRLRVLCRVAGDWRFRVQMKSDQLQTPVLEEESTRIYKDQ